MTTIKATQERYPNMFEFHAELAGIACDAMDLEWGHKDQVAAEKGIFKTAIALGLIGELEARISTQKFSTSEVMDWIECRAAEVVGLTPILAKYQDDDVSTRITVGDKDINEKVFDDELVDWLLEDREELIDRIIVWAGEAYNSADRQSDFILMKTDLVLLMGLTDAYVWSSISTNMYVSPTKDTLRFNEISKQVLEANENL